MSNYHGKYYNPSHEDDYGAYLSGECDSNNIDRCKSLSKITSLKICKTCPFPDDNVAGIPSNNGQEEKE